jgi:hypothetical protein
VSSDATSLPNDQWLSSVGKVGGTLATAPMGLGPLAQILGVSCCQRVGCTLLSRLGGWKYALAVLRSGGGRLMARLHGGLPNFQ